MRPIVSVVGCRRVVACPAATYTEPSGKVLEATLAKKQPEGTKPVARPRFWISMLILVGALVLVGLGQWDMVVALAIGLFVGNVLSWLVGRD
ncbi:MAG: hypothetical protein ACYC5O_05030 [Anaerolineae bacterium]